MNKIDNYIKETLLEILEEGQWDKNPRTKWSDKTPAHSKFITQKVFQYDISKGEYPITTLRNGSLKMAFQELKTIYVDQSNRQEDFLKNGVNWWGEWMNKNGDLGTAYSWNLESGVSEKVILPKKVDYSKINVNSYNRPLLHTLEKAVDGIIYQSENNKGFIIVDKKVSKSPINGQWKYKIQFLNTGSYKIIRGNDLYQQVKNNMLIKDEYEKDIYGIGYVNNLELKGEYYFEYQKWRSMIKRCYGKNSESSFYKNCYVDNRWHCFDNFVKSLPYIPNYFIAKREGFKGWDLDKDYYSDDIKIYSQDTCVFLSEKHNVLYSKKSYFKVLDKNTNLIHKVIGIENVSNIIGLNYKALSQRKFRNKLADNITYKNFEVYQTNEVYRFENSKNQVNELLKALEENMYSRRHMLSFFNWANQNDKTLVECAFMSLFSVRPSEDKNYIDLTLIQRSSDFLTACTINQIQYVMLGMAVCNHLTFKTGIKHELGKFMHVVQNVHIYDRHQKVVEEILDRRPTGKQPKVKLVCEPKDFYSHTFEDFEFEGLEGIQKLKNKIEIAV